MIINPSVSKEDFYINMFVDDKYLGNCEFGISFSELIKELSFLGSIGLKFNLNNTLQLTLIVIDKIKNILYTLRVV